MRLFPINKLRLSETLLYVLLWSAIFLVPVLNAEMTSRIDPYLDEVFMAWYKTIPYFLIFVVNNNLLVPKFLHRRQYDRYIFLGALLSVVVFVIVDLLQVNVAPRLIESGLISPDTTFSDLPIFWNVVLSLFMIVANNGVSLIYKSLEADKQMESLKSQNMQVEMDYLKYQINPHFFMNTLNNIHALIDIDSESAKEAVIELSKMMRYVLYESGNKSISLSTDLKFIRNYIELMKIRYDGSIRVDMVVDEALPANISIPPLLFIVFVENAFKHGIGLGCDNFVDLRIEYREGCVDFRLVNSLPLNSVGLSGGIGLINARKRLEMIYGKRFTLESIRGEGDYMVHLTIPVEL